MSAILPLLLLVIVIALVAAMPWHRPDPNHLFCLELLQEHLRDEFEVSSDTRDKSKPGMIAAA